MSYHGRFQQAKPPKKKKGMKILLIIMAVLLVVLIAAAVIGITTYKKMLSKVNYVTMPTYEVEETFAEDTEPVQITEETEIVEEETTPTTVETTYPPMKPEDIINILVVGQSARGGEDAAMADTTILVSLNKYNDTLTLTSFLRDAYVDLPDYRDGRGTLHTCGWNKLTSCYALGYSWDGAGGAMKMMNDCLKINFGVEVDYNVEIDMECFITLVDILGGVGLEITQAEADYLNADDRYVYRDIEAGFASLCGSEALSYARMRKAEGDNDSDIKRSARQRLVIEKLLDKVRHLGLKELQSVADTLLPEITTTMTPGDIIEIMTKILPVLKSVNIVGETIPVSGTGWGEIIDIYEDGIPDSVIKFEAPQQKRLIRAVTELEGTN